MEDTKNINKKLLIAMFTALSLIGFIYSIYSQATSTQNNAVSSLESNSIIQEIINSSANGYSSAGQYLANFLSIKAIPSYVWTIMIFLMTTLFFVAIYTFLFEIFIQRTGISESETMKKAKILFIFILSIFSALAIGYAIPFLLNLYGLILLILVIITLFFFGRATISYGKSFYYSIKSFANDIEKDYLEFERELEELRKEKGIIPEEKAEYLTETINKINNDFENDFKNIVSKLTNADNKFADILSTIIKEHKDFFDKLINNYEDFLKKREGDNNNASIYNQKSELEKFIRTLRYIKNIDIKRLQSILKNSESPDIQKIRSIGQPRDIILRIIHDRKVFKALNDTDKQNLQNILDNVYNSTLSQYQKTILEEIDNVLQTYNEAYASLMTFYHKYENTLNALNRNIGSVFRKFSSSPNKLENHIKGLINSVYRKIKFLESLKGYLH